MGSEIGASYDLTTSNMPIIKEAEEYQRRYIIEHELSNGNYAPMSERRYTKYLQDDYARNYKDYRQGHITPERSADLWDRRSFNELIRGDSQ